MTSNPVSEQAVRDALHTVIDPEIGKPIDEIGMLGGFEIDSSEVRVDILLTVSNCPLKDELERRVTDAVHAVGGVGSVEVRMGVMEEEKRAELASNLQKEIQFRDPNSRTTVIGISSGKGGVGKSTVTTNLAAAMQARGHVVGVLDADIWGFSVPRMLGLRGERPVAFDGTIMPLNRNGVKVISIGFFLPNEEEPVVWRGPMLHKALEQFLSDVYWGADLEYLLIDLPPGTGDISLSLATFLPNMGMVVVTTPQPVAQKVARRAAEMAHKVNLELAGVVENMSGFTTPGGERFQIFGEGGGQELADELDVPLVGKVPLTMPLREQADNGLPLVLNDPDDPAAQAVEHAARGLVAMFPLELPILQMATVGAGGDGPGDAKPAGMTLPMAG